MSTTTDVHYPSLLPCCIQTVKSSTKQTTDGGGLRCDCGKLLRYYIVTGWREAPATTQAEAEVERRVDYFDSEEVREHVRESRHCQHGLGFTYDFCPIVNAVNSHARLCRVLTAILDDLHLHQDEVPPILAICELYAEGRQLLATINAADVLNRKEGE